MASMLLRVPRRDSNADGRNGQKRRRLHRGIMYDRLCSGVPLSNVSRTHVRYWVIVFAVTLAIITYVDRVCISQAAPLISRDLGFSKEQMGYVFSAFVLAYALFEIPSGYLGDRFGARTVLMRSVGWWSFFTIATGWAMSFASMVVTRFMFGAGQAGCFPHLTRAFTTWLLSY